MSKVYNHNESRGAASKALVKPAKQSAQEQVEKTERDFLKIMAATVRYQNPCKPADPGQIAQTMASIQQTKEAIRNRVATENLAESMSGAQLHKALPLQGKTVQYSTGSKTFNGRDDIEFKYQLKFEEKARPKGSHIETSIRILDANGVEVLKTKGKKEGGIHTLKWDGKNSTGRKMPKGEYSIKVDSWFETIVDGKVEKKPIEAGSFISGEVESIEAKDGTVKLLIGGEYIDLDDIIKVEADSSRHKAPEISEYSSYIGQTAELDDDSLSVDLTGSANISFKCAIDRPGKAAIHIYDDKNNLVGITILDNIRSGLNSRKFMTSNAITLGDAEKFRTSGEGFARLAQGAYKYKLALQNAMATDPEKYSPISTTRTVAITGLDFSMGAYIVAGAEKFPVNSIKKLSSSLSPQTLLQQGAEYLGKTAVVNLSKFKLQGRKAVQFVEVPKIEAGSRYGDAFMYIFDSSGKQVAQVKKPKNALVIADKPNIKLIKPEDLFDFLDNASQTRACLGYDLHDYYSKADVKQQIDLNRGLGHDQSYEAFSAEIVEQYKAGNLFLDYEKILPGYDRLSAQDQTNVIDSIKIALGYSDIVHDYDTLAPIDQELVRQSVDSGRPYTGFNWDAKDFDGKAMPSGNYTYKFLIEKIHTSRETASEVSELVELEDSARLKISEFRNDSGELKFLGYRVNEAGDQLSTNPEEFSIEEIKMLST